MDDDQMLAKLLDFKIEILLILLTSLYFMVTHNDAVVQNKDFYQYCKSINEGDIPDYRSLKQHCN